MMVKRAGVHKKGTFSLRDLLENARKDPNFKKAGAITLFIGVVREEAKKGEKVEKLELEAYEERANQTLETICNDLLKKPGITDVQIHHLLGEFSAGEDLVYVLVAGSHRQNIFPVLEQAVERYKSEAPIFKKEHVITKRGKKNAYWVPEKNIA
jgi:molybdopterin synthase catalytic subunit